MPNELESHFKSPDSVPNSRISLLLPKYYEQYEHNLRFQPLSLWEVKGHEVAWMQYQGTIEYDITGQGREGQSFTRRALYCECNFQQGIGWDTNDRGRFALETPEHCLPRSVIVSLRHQQLQRLYQDFYCGGPNPNLNTHTDEIIQDLITKAKNGEFLEDGEGASFWGGYFYLQTVASITGQNFNTVRKTALRLVEEKKICLEGAVVQEFQAPPPEKWVEYSTFERDGFVAKAFLPGHSKMDQSWRIELIAPNGESMIVPQSKITLNQLPYFGPDKDDVAKVQIELDRLLTNFEEEL